jgi:PTH1 family peptidyl-tRNA hydrolase
VVKELVEKLNINPSDILVVYDDTNLEPGALRIRKSGSDGGHNGIKSIIYHLENDKFARLRIGIGGPDKNQDLAEYVLSEFPQNEMEKVEQNFPLLINLIKQFIIGGIDSMLNYYSKESNTNSSNIS